MRRKILPYEPWLKPLARKLRNNCTLSEKTLWKALKGNRLRGYDFHRQKPLLRYIADFYCYELKLVIELDGITHHLSDIQRKDEIKERALNGLGLTVLRFRDEDVMGDLGWVLSKIEDYVDAFEERELR